MDGELLEGFWRSEELGGLLEGWGAGRLLEDSAGCSALSRPLGQLQTLPGYHITRQCQSLSWLPRAWVWLCQLRATGEHWQGAGSPRKS